MNSFVNKSTRCNCCKNRIEIPADSIVLDIEDLIIAGWNAVVVGKTAILTKQCMNERCTSELKEIARIDYEEQLLLA